VTRPPVATPTNPTPARPRWQQALLALDHGFGWLAGNGAALLLALAAGLALYQVLTRFLLSQPSTWSAVVVQLSLVWMVFLGLVGALRQGTLLAVDAAQRYAPPAVRRWLERLSTAATLTVLAVLLWHGGLLAWRVRFQTLAGLEISIAWAYAAIPAGALAGLLALAARQLEPPAAET